MEVRPPWLLGTLIGGGVAVALLIAAAAVGILAFLRPISLIAFGMILVVMVLLFLAASAGFLSYGCWSLRYTLDRNQLTIHWGFTRRIIPLSEIQRLVSGVGVGSMRIGGINWRGYHVGRGTTDALGRALFYSTHRSPHEVLFVVTPAATYGVSVPDFSRFAREIEWRQQLGPTMAVETARYPTAWPLSFLGREKVMLGMIGFALLLNVSLWGYLSHIHAALPNLLPLHFTPLGEVDRVGLKQEIFWLPTMGFIALIFNLLLGLWLYRRERLGAHLCLGAALFLQILFWLAAIRNL